MARQNENNMTFNGQLVQVADLSDPDRDEMFALMKTYYEHTERSVFEADLDEKQWVILLHDPIHRAVRGFLTQMILNLVVDGRPVQALFSGDTIVDREPWANNPLAQIWRRLALSLIDAHDSAPLYWFLLTKGYKTYRFLPIFFHEFYPCKDHRVPAWASRLIDTLGQHKDPTAYDSSAGIVRADQFGCRLRPKVAEINDRRFQDPHVQFFSETNPQHAFGDELCCIAPLTRENFTPSAYRVIGSEPVLSEVST